MPLTKYVANNIEVLRPDSDQADAGFEIVVYTAADVEAWVKTEIVTALQLLAATGIDKLEERRLLSERECLQDDVWWSWRVSGSWSNWYAGKLGKLAARLLKELA